MRIKNAFILTTYVFVNNKILSCCCGPKPINKEDLTDVENGNIIDVLRKVCQVHSDVKNKKLEEEYKFILDQVIDNGKNKKPEKLDDDNKNERFVSFLYKLTIFFKLSNDRKSLVPVKCSELPNIRSGKFYSHDYILFSLNFKSRNLLEDDQSHYFKKDVEKDINDSFKDHKFIKMEEIVKVFNKYKPDYFYIIVDKPDHSSEYEKPINYGFVFEETLKHQNIFSDNVIITERKKGCC